MHSIVSELVGKDLACGSVRCHAGLRSALVAAILQADNLVAFRQLISRKLPWVLIRHLDADRWSIPVFLLCHSTKGKDGIDHHVKILVFVQIVDLKQVLRFEAVILAALEEQLYIFPLLKENQKPKIQSRETF